MKVLVTGASGTVGGLVTRHLAGKEIAVRGVVHRPESATALHRELPAVEAVAADLADEARVPELLADVDTVFLVTANVPTQLAQEQTVIRAAAKAGARWVVKISVGGVSPDAPLALARVHYAAEQELTAGGIPHTILRPAFFMDNLLQYIPWIDPAGRLELPLGDGAMAMIDARDIADVAVAELLAPTGGDRDLVLTGPEDLTAAQALARIADVVGRPLSHVDGTRESFLRRYLADGNRAGYAEDMATLYDGVLRHGYGAGTTATVEEVTGHPPRTIDDFARQHAAKFSR
ncbi:NAD(P)H-binding protein [Amycolatopsis sp. A133]|uniref:NmrA family NAD(P)-binding protein n=1 Tax=Amycolatopsis sp. A133 TaxID=3064472 RepID=UPI0027FB3294|nr:NAD(P)H-binding protein [Amycolatopsis sp. A133]MDQ7809797.1 NAD(P)H-binding protein [Amycolatopsis sp. A133]